MDGSSNDLDYQMCENNAPAGATMSSRVMILIDEVHIILSFSDGAAHWDDGCV